MSYLFMKKQLRGNGEFYLYVVGIYTYKVAVIEFQDG